MVEALPGRRHSKGQWDLESACLAGLGLVRMLWIEMKYRGRVVVVSGVRILRSWGV